MDDGVRDLISAVIFLVWLGLQIRGAIAKRQGQPRPAPKVTRRAAVAAASAKSMPQGRRDALARAALTPAHEPESQGSAIARQLEPLGQALDRLGQEADTVAMELDVMGAAGATLKDVLVDSVRAPLAEVVDRWTEVGRLLQANTQVSNLGAHVDVTARWVREIGRRLGVVRHLAAVRMATRDGAALDDADTIAEAFFRPFGEFAESRGISLPRQKPIAVPARLGKDSRPEAMLPNHPVVAVPSDFGQDVFWWTSVPHSVAHLIWERVPGLADEIESALGLQGTTMLLEPAYESADDLPHRLVRAWIPELFADAVTVMLAGPSALHGMVHAFEDSRVPVRLDAVRTMSDGTYDPHPPANIRILVAVRLLRRLGFEREATAMERLWQARHPEATTVVVPIARKRTVQFDVTLLADYVAGWSIGVCTQQFQSLAGHSFELIPGFSMSPGMWRKVCESAAELELDDAFPDDPRIVVAAAMEARHHNPAAQAAIRSAARAAIVGAHAPLSERRGRRHRTARTGRFSRDEFRDALVLTDIAKRRSGPRRPGEARLSGRPAA